MELVLIRHALPERIESGETVADPSLSATGRHQAAAMAERLRHEAISHVYVSPKLRARETAAPLEDALGVTAEVVDAFSEIDRDATAYIPVEELVAEDHPMLVAMREQRWAEIGYIEPEVFREEVRAAADEVLARHDEGDRIAIVAHGGTINAMVTAFAEVERVFLFSPDYTSISRLRQVPRVGGLMIHSLNDTGHLDPLR